MRRRVVCLESPDFFVTELRRIAAEEGDEIIVVSPDPRHRGRPDVIDADPRDGCAETVERIKRAVGVPDAVITAHEVFMTQAASIADAFGIQRTPVEAVRAARDKACMKAVWSAAGVRTPHGYFGASSREVLARAGDLAYPLIVKPSQGYASCGVRRVESAGELAAHLRTVFMINSTVVARERLTGAGVLVEEYVDGPEYSIDTIWWRGEPVGEAILSKGTLAGPCFPDRLYYLDPNLAPGITDAIRDVTHRAVATLGIDHAATHTEVRFRGDEPFVLETTNRPGAGGLFYTLFSQAYGVDYHRAYYQAVVVDERPDLVPRRTPAGDEYLFWYNIPHRAIGVLREVRGLAELRARPEIIACQCEAKPGSVLYAEGMETDYFCSVLGRYRRGAGDHSIEQFVAELDDAVEAVV